MPLVAERIREQPDAVAEELVRDGSEERGTRRHRARHRPVDIRNVEMDRHRRASDADRAERTEVRILIGEHEANELARQSFACPGRAHPAGATWPAATGQIRLLEAILRESMQRRMAVSRTWAIVFMAVAGAGCTILTGVDRLAVGDGSDAGPSIEMGHGIDAGADTEAVAYGDTGIRPGTGTNADTGSVTDTGTPIDSQTADTSRPGTSGDACAAIADFVVTSTSSMSIALAWTGAPDVTVRVARKSYCGTDNYVTLATLPAGATSYTDSMVQLNWVYWYEIVATDASSATAWAVLTTQASSTPVTGCVVGATAQASGVGPSTCASMADGGA
jgi:hypothetical protein